MHRPDPVHRRPVDPHPRACDVSATNSSLFRARYHFCYHFAPFSGISSLIFPYGCLTPWGRSWRVRGPGCPSFALVPSAARGLRQAHCPTRLPGFSMTTASLPVFPAPGAGAKRGRIKLAPAGQLWQVRPLSMERPGESRAWCPVCLSSLGWSVVRVRRRRRP